MDAVTPEQITWPVLMQAMLIGAVRGMAEAHAQLAEDGATIQPLNELTMFQASELLTALFLEESTDYADRASFPEAAEMVRNHILTHLESFRRQREKSGEPTLFKVLDSAGLDRHSSN